MLDKYFENVHFVQDNGMSFTVEITPDDGYIPYIPEIKKVCMENLGALCHVTVSRDERKKGFPLLSNLPMDEFINTWKDFDSGLFELQADRRSLDRIYQCNDDTVSELRKQRLGQRANQASWISGKNLWRDIHGRN